MRMLIAGGSCRESTRPRLVFLVPHSLSIPLLIAGRYLADNDLQGSLPSEWKDLTALKHM